ncbi:hypothetical protein HYC85_016877 [Camellia sinensis]|uniref:Aminoacyl-tRNA synthetase class II (D/K/N) domain-containing protein n=1 Tax=Camellia sinensis TaxID=4442 RepID=A0A7J7H0W5_CAMSI|nr:hypothetical protein HYC85_016877 [Camellia sinensis]
MEQQQQHQEQEESSTQSKKAAKMEAAKLEKQRRQRGFTVQCVLSVAPDVVSLQMVKFATGLSKDSYVDVERIISVPKDPIIGASQQVLKPIDMELSTSRWINFRVEIQVKKLYCISKAVPALAINIEDAARGEIEIEKALQAGKQFVRVNQDTRLNFRVLDLRTPANQGIFRVQCQVENIFRQFLLADGFVGIHTPKAEDSYTHRHLCEFTGLDVEMEIKEHYSEVMDIVDRLFVAMFDSLNEKCQKELEAIGKQYPFEPLKVISLFSHCS